MKKVIMLFAVVVMLTGVTTSLMAQTSATVTGTAAGAKLIVPMTLTQTSPLHFGTINVQLGVAGTCLLPSNSTTRQFTGGVVASTVAPLATNAAYDVTGTMNVTYALSLPPTITVTETMGATATMTISLLKARFLNAGADAIICESAGTYTISGATAQFATSYLWSTSGTGTFDDATLLNPVYSPSAADISAGSVTLTITVASASPC